MKFPQLPLGQRFLFRGEAYVKIGPLTARREQDGENRLFPRSALVSLSQPGYAGLAVEVGTLPAWVSSALDAYEEQLRAALFSAGASTDPDLRARLEEGLAAARGAFLEAMARHAGLPERT
jgi:hypothetical protein